MKMIKIGMLAMAMAVLGASAATTTTKTVTWSLPEGWDADVTYPMVEGYRAIVGPELSARSDIGKIADPDLPYYRIRVALPANGTFDTATCEVEWEKVDMGGALPLPIAQPVPTGGELVYPQPGDAYRSIYPAENVKTEYLQIINDIRMMPITVTPFRWDGQAKQLYKAKNLKVTATYTVSKSLLRLTTSSASSKSSLNDFQKMALSMTINPSDATTKASSGLKLSTSSTRENLAYFGNDNEADYVIISPPLFVDLWKAFAEFRKTTANGSSHTFCVVNTEKIYKKYDTVDGDDALKIHRYIEELYAISPRKIKYVVLGAAAKKYQYERDKMIPARYIVCGGSLSQLLDMYYGCMDRMPVGVGVEVWDYDGDGAYLGHKNANGSYSQDSNAYIDWAQDLAVFRFPLMKEVYESGVTLTAEQIMTNFINKITHLESDDYAHRYSAIYTGSTGFSTSTYGACGRSEMYGLIVDEREFFDQGLNLFSPEHPSWGSDSEFVPRDHGWEFLTYLRGNRKVLMNNSSYSTCTYQNIYNTSGEFLDTVCHGWARGAVGAVSAGDEFLSTGFYTIFDCAVPCDTGMYDYCPGGSYGITNCICVGESPILAPNGGGLASINNTRYGWSARCSTSYGNGWTGQHSFKLSWLFLRSLTGVTSWLSNQTYEPMNAGEALMWAHNNHGTPYASAAWGLSGAQVTGQGDPLARLSVQYERTWNPSGDSKEWSTNAANWSIAGKDAPQVFDISRSVYLPLAGKGSQTFEISNVDSNYFTTAGFYVQQDANATLTLKGNGTFKSLRETVITNGNVRWEVAGGAGRYGVTFVGNTRGNIELPGNNKRYFGEKFVNVGTISVSGGNVVIDTPRDAKFGAGNSLDYEEIEFVAANAGDVAEWNQLRSRNAGIFQTNPEKHLRVVNSKLLLQTYNIGGSGSGNKDKPLIYATNSTIKVQANPVWKEEYFVRPTHLYNSTLIGDYAKFAFGPEDGTTGYDLYVSGKCAISGDTPIKLNGELRIHFLGDNAELELANSLCDGTAAGSVRFDGTGTVKVSATQNFTNPLTVSSGVTLEGVIAKLSTGSIVIKNGATAQFAVIPLDAVEELTFEQGATVNLPGPTANGIYQVVDSAVTTLTDGGATYYDCSTTPATQIVGDISEGYLLKTANILFWKGVNGTWNKSDSSVWTNAIGETTAYSDGVPLCFADGASDTITVTVGEAVAPGFMDFRNHASSYVFDGTDAISVNSLAIGTEVTFNAPLTIAKTLKVTDGSTVVKDIAAPTVEIANGGSLRVKGQMTVPTQKIKKLKFSFAATKDSGNVAAVQELRLFNKDGFFYLPKDTVITDIVGQTVTITGNNGNYGHTMTGDTDDEDIGALVDGKITGNNKWWASSKSAPTWFEITFPSEVDAITGYDFFTADSAGRNPKAWSVYTAGSDGNYSLAATKSDVVFATTHAWMVGDGSASQELYPLIDVNGFVRVKSGGTLVLDGSFYANLSLEADAILAVDGMSSLTNKQSTIATLTLPESGTVKIDLSNAEDTDKKFPILVGYNLTKDDLAKFECTTEEGMLVVKDGDLYTAPKSELPPYTATVTANAKWSALDWKNANNTSFTWNDANRRPNGEVQITANTAVTIDVDVGETIGTLVLKGSGAITVTNSVDDPLSPSAIDDSQHTGTLDWQIPTGSAAITAGSDTCIRSGAAGSGLLTVGANKKVTLGDGVTFANRDIDKDGWVRFEGARTDFELAGYTGANYSFANGSLTGDFTLTNHTIRSRSGDYVKFVGNDANFYARSLVNFDIADGTVEYETNGDTTWFGRSATSGTTAATVFNQSGGTFRCLATGTGAGGGLLVGYEGGNAVGEELYLNLTGGSFEVPNSYLNFGNPTVVTLLKNAHLKAKGYIASMSSGTINLGTNTTDTVVMEVGSLGLNAGAASITMYNGSSIVGFEDGAFIEGGITLRAAKRSSTDEMTIAATNGTTTTLQNLTFEFYVQDGALSAYNGGETVVFGNSAKGWDGTIAISSETCLPVNWKVNAGTVALGAVRYASGSKLKAAPGGVVTFTLSEDEYESGMAIDLIRCDTWVNSYTATQLAEKFRVYRANGTLADGTLSATDGTVTYIPAGGASEYVFPLTATVTGDATWSSLTWSDRNGKAYSGDWSNVKSAQLINNAGKYTVTMDRTVSLLAMNTQVSANKKLTLADNGDYKMLITSRFNDATSAGTTVLNIDLGQGFAIYAGKDLQLTGSMDTTVNHGTLIIGSSNKATVNNGYWNGDVEMADSTANLYFYSTTAFDRVPCSLNSSSMGKVTYNATINCAGQAISFGSDSSRATDGRFVMAGAVTCSDVFVGLGNGSIVGFDVNGGSLTMAKETHDSQWVLGQDAGSQVTTWIYPSATIDAPDTTLWVGKGGSATLHLGNGISVKGLVNDPDNATDSEVLLYYGNTLLLGAGGVNFNSNLSESFYVNGTIKVTEDASITVTPAIANAFMTLEAPANVTMTINSPIVLSERESSSPTLDISGGGTVVLNDACSFGGNVNLNAGTLKLSTYGLLGNCPAVFKGGKIEVQLTLEEVRAKVGNTYTLYKTADTKENAETYTTVIVQETGNVVNGTFAKSGDNLTFTPAATGDITGEIVEDGNVAWTNIVWRDNTGVRDPSVWESVVGNVILSNKFSSTVTIDDTISLATLRLYNDGTLTVEGPFSADSVDDSHSTGKTTIGDQGTIVSVKAGKDTVLESSGSGTLTIESGMKATSRVAFGGTIANSGTYVYDYPVTTLSSFTDDRRYAGGGTAGETTYSSGTLKIENGAYVYSGKFAMLTATANISGDAQVTTPRFVLGDGSNGNSVFNLSGGTFEVTGSVAPTSNQATILLGHWSSTPTMTISGGTFIATNAVTRLGWDGRPTVTVGGGGNEAVMHVKGVKSGDNSHNSTATFNLNANGVLELGDGGLQALGSSATYNFNGGKIVAFADATLKSSTADKMSINNAVTFAAENGKTLTVDADFAGTGTITCGETGKEGTVVFINGTYAETTITGAFAIRLTAAQQSAGTEAILCKTPDTTDLNKVQVQLTSGEVAPGTVSKKDGNLVWAPPACTMPLRAVAKGTVEWADLEWFDSSTPSNAIPKAYWSLLGAISVDITIEKDAVLTMPAQTELTGKTIAVNGSGTVIVNNIWPSSWSGLTDATKWQGTLKIVNKTGCDGLNFVYLGNSLSTVELDNVVGNFSQESVSASNPCGVTYPYTLMLSGSGLTINNGYSEKGFAFARVIGDGSITFGKSGDPRMRLVLVNATDYAGTLTVLGNSAVTVGTPTSTIDDGKIVITDGKVASGKAWTAPNGVEVTGTLAMTPNDVKPFNCAVTFASGSTLNVLQSENDCESVPLTTGTLTIDLTNTTLKFNNVAKMGEWTVAAGYLVKTVELTATSEGVVLNEHHNDKILSVTGAANGFIAVNTAISPVSFTTKGTESVLLKYSGTGSMTIADGFTATAAKVVIDASGMDGTELAKNAVCGAPYSHWLVKGAVSGTVELSGLPVMPIGYEITWQRIDDYGVRLIITAPTQAMFDAVSINVTPESTNDLDADTEYGLYPMAGSQWGFVKDATAVTHDSITFTPYASSGSFATENGVTADLTASTRIMRGLCKDVSEDRTVGFNISGIKTKFGADAKYRVIVYLATDTANVYFAPVSIGGVLYAGPTEGQNTQGYTIKGSTANRWGASSSANATYPVTEGVNAVISDVLDVDSVQVRSTRTYNKYSTRASIAAVQIVKVGDIYEIPGAAYQAEVVDDTDWENGDGDGLDNHNTWANHTNSTLRLTMKTDEATVTFDTVVTGATLSVVSLENQTLTLKKTDGVDFAVPRYDFSAASGAVVLADDVGTDTSINLGRTLVLNGAMNGTLVSPTAASTIRYAKQDLTIASTALNDTVTNNFAKATVNGNVFTGRKYLVRTGDDLTIQPTGGGNNNQMFSGNIVVEGGKLTLKSNTSAADKFWYGQCGASSFTQYGGETVADANSSSTSNNGCFLYGVSSSGNIPVTILGGTFTVTNSPVCFWQDASITMTIGGTGRVRVKGLWGNGTKGIVNLNAGGTLEVGATGILSSLKTFNLNGGTLIAYANATMAEPIVLGGNSTIAAESGKTNTVSAVISGTGNLTIGAEGKLGTVILSGANTFSGSISVLPGVSLGLSTASRANNLTFGEGAALDLVGSFTQAGTYDITSGSFEGNPTVTLNGKPLPHNCTRNGKTITITADNRSWNNPVTGDAQEFTYAFFGTSDANWATIANWREYGTISWNTMTGTAPMLSGSSRWNPTVIDGNMIEDVSRKSITLSGTNMEGWTPRLALFNGVNVTIGNMTKLQSEGNGVKWVWVDETSKLTFTQIASGNFSHDFKLYVAGKDGLTFTQAIPKDGTAFEYYLSTNGTVKYEAELTKCSHAIKQFCLTMDKPSAYKIIKERTLVTYPSASVSFTTDSIEVPAVGGITPSNLGRTPTTADAFGAYGVEKGGTALVVKYVDYSQFYTNLADNAEIAVSTINTLAATAGSEPYHVVFGKGVTVEFDEAFASNVAFDFTKMTADSTFVKTGDDEFEWSDAFASFAGKFDIREGVMTIPTNTLANALTVSGGTLNLSIDGGLVAGTTYTITSGTMTGITKNDLTVNGEAIPVYWKLENGQLSKIVWTYPIAFSPTGNFTTATAAWTDSSSPAQTYCEGFDSPVTSMLIDGSAKYDVTYYWTNDVAILNVGTLSLSYIWADIHVVNSNGCSIVANTFDVYGYDDYYGYAMNEMGVHLEFDTGSAAIIAGDDTWLYGNGSGTITLNEDTQVTFYPQAGTNLTYSGAITGTGKIVKDGAGTLTLTGAISHSGGTTVKAGTLRVAPSVLNGAVTIEAGATLDVTITGGLVAGQEYAIMGSGTLTIKDGATVTVNGAALPEGWNVQDGKIVYTISTEPFILTITDAGSVDWSAADWTGSNGVAVPASRWSESVGSATINVDGDVAATLVADVAVNVTALTVNSAEELTLNKGSASLTIDTLIVAANKCVSVGDGVTVTTPSVSAGGSIRFLAAAQATSPKVTTAGAIVGYKNASFSAMSDDQWVLKVESGDAVALTKSGTYLAADVRTGGTLTLGSGDEWIYGGKTKSTTALTNSVITVNGGTVTSTISGTGTSANQRGLLIGNSCTEVGVSPKIVVNDGLFDISNGQITFWESAHLIMNGGTLKTAGIGKGACNTAGTLDLNGGVIELGATGMRKLADAAPTFNFNLKGGTLKAVADTSVAAGVTTVAANGTTSTLAAATGKKLTIATTISGQGGIAVGTSDAIGTVAFTAAPTFTGAIAVNAGTLTLPTGSYANAITVAEGATLNLTGTLGDELVITTGTFTNHGTVKVNGEAIPEGWVLDGNKIRKLATQPFIYIIAGTQGDVNWTEANWVGQNGYAVLPSQWSEADVTAVVQGGAGDSARLVADTALNLSTLTIETTDKITLAKGGDDAFAVATLSVANGYSVALESGVSVTAYDVKAGGHIHFLNETEVTTPTVSTAGAMVSYKNASFTTAPTDYSWILRVEDGDSVSMSLATQFFPIDVRGGTLTLGGATAVGEYIYGGKNGGGANTNSVITVNGGRIVANINGTATSGNSSRGFIYGCTASNIKQRPTLIVNDGEFDISSGILSPWEFGDLVVNGGVLKAKGICKGGNYGGTFAFNGGELQIGATGMSIRGSTFPMTVGGDAKITSTAAMSITLPTTIELGNTLTFNAAAGDINAAGANVDNDGTIVVEAGNVNLGTARGDIEAKGADTVITLYETVNDGGKVTIKTENANGVVMKRADGTTAIETTSKDNGDGTYTFSFEPQLDGTVCWWDYEFNGNVNSVGTDTTGLTAEGTSPYFNSENTAILVGHATHYRGATYPAEFTAVMQCKMVDQQQHVEMGFGSTTGGTKINVALACGNPTKEEVLLIISEGTAAKKTVSMTVPNAYTADHLYAFACKTILDGLVEKTQVNVYLDGQMLDSFTFDSVVTLGGGFQIGSVHGGVPSGCIKATTANANAYLNFLRVYKCELSAAVMKAYAEKYPYVSPNGSYTREVEGGDVTWKTDDDSWQQKGEGGTSTNTPAEKATVELSATDDTTVTMELTKDVTYEAMTLDGEGEVTIVKGDDAEGQVKITGRLTVNTDAKIDPAAIDIANTPITVAAGKTLTIDMTGVDLDDVLQTTTYKLTGLVSEGVGSEVAVATNAYEEIEGRTVALAPNADQHYELKVEVVPEEVTLALDLDNDSKEVSFSGTDTLDIPLDWTLQLTNTTALTHGNVTKTTVAAALNATNTTNAVVIPNGIKPWESYVLTLSPTNQYSVPVIAPIQGTETDKITFALDNVAVRSEVSDKVDVTYKVYSGTTIGAKTEASDPVAAGETIKIDLPESGVKYYHIEVDIAPKK